MHQKFYLVNPKIEASEDDGTAGHSCKTRLLAENEICEQNVEDGGQTPSDVVEGYANVAEAEVVECDHPDEDDGERKHLLKVCMKDLLISFLVTCFNIEGSTVSSGKLTRFGSFVAAHLCKIKT